MTKGGSIGGVRCKGMCRDYEAIYGDIPSYWILCSVDTLLRKKQAELQNTVLVPKSDEFPHRSSALHTSFLLV